MKDETMASAIAAVFVIIVGLAVLHPGPQAPQFTEAWKGRLVEIHGKEYVITSAKWLPEERKHGYSLQSTTGKVSLFVWDGHEGLKFKPTE